MAGSGLRGSIVVALVSLTAASHAAGDGAAARTNVFNDPFFAVTHGLPGCPVPEGPLLTEEEAKAEAHGRSQRGVSCYLAGRCRLSNAFLYDKEIIPRVEKAIHADGRYEDTSVWVLGQRRWVFLKGCVRTKDEATALERLVRDIDDVEQVINELSVGTSAKPAYAVDHGAAP